MLTRFNLFIIALAFVVGIVIYLTQTKSLFVDTQDLRNRAVNTVFNTGLLPESIDIEGQVAPNDDVLNIYRGRDIEMFNPEDVYTIDPVLELNDVSPFYIAHPEFATIQNSIFEKNPPVPVATSVTV